MSRLRVIVIALALVILPACECGPFSACPAPQSVQPSGSTSLRPITVLLGFRPDVQFAPFYVGIQDGYYADVGLDVTLEHASGGDVIRQVADEQAAFGVADATDVMIARTSGIPIRYVSTLYQAFPVAIIGPRGSVPSDPAGLAGKTIGTPGRFGSSWHALLALLDAGGLTAADVTIREYPQFNQVEGLLNGDVDLITGFRTNEPLQLEKQGMAVDMLTIDDIAPLPGPGVVASDAIIDADPALVRAFTDATARAQQAVIDDPQVGLDAATAMVPTLGEDRATGLAVLRATVGLWSEGGFAAGRIDRDRWSAAFATMRRLGFIDGSVAVDEMIWTD
jgi:NitT/TauT family transport system substrate-binding protein